MRNFFPNLSASIALRANTVVYTLDGRQLRFPVSSIRLVGEFTTAPGDLETQYFFVFLLKDQDQLLEVPSFTENLFEFLTDLKNSLAGMGGPTLQLSEENDSNILFPEKLRGQKLFEFQTESRPWINLPILKHLGKVQEVKKVLLVDEEQEKVSQN